MRARNNVGSWALISVLFLTLQPAYGVIAEQPAVVLPSVEKTQAIAEEGFIYGLPIVMNYAVMNELAIDRNSGQFKAPFNVINNEARVFTYEDTAVVTPNSDTPYSNLWLDLRAEPMVISVPAIPKDRYYSVQMVDGNTYNYGYIGSRATGVEAGHYLVVGPDWTGDKPPGIKEVFQSSTPLSLVIFRTQLFEPNDMPEVVKIQAGYQAQPLSSFLDKPAPVAEPKVEFVPATTAGIKANFWNYLDAALEFIPETDLNKDIHAKLAQLGIGTDQAFDFKVIPSAQQSAMLLGMKAGDEKVSEYLSSGMAVVNGWTIPAMAGDSRFFNGDWLKRAAGAKGGIYLNDSNEATYPMTRVDKSGQTLDASLHNYTLTFAADDMPPVKAFWSVTMYDAKSQLLIKNPINRYLINSPMLAKMKKNPDDSLTLYIQKNSPGKDKESNWLPAPDGPVYLVMRLYWPKPATEALSVLPVGKGTWQPPSIVMAN